MHAAAGTAASWVLPHQQRSSLRVSIKHCTRPTHHKQRCQQSTFARKRSKNYDEDVEQDYEREFEQEYQQEYQQAVDPSPVPAVRQRALPLYVTLPGAVLVAYTFFRILRKIQGRGSVNGLVSRGLVSEEKGTNKGEPYYKDIMKHVNTVHMEELSDDQIKAARARRSKERDTPRLDLDQVELPDNHPFAVKKKVSKDEEELAKKRLEVKKGLPLQDLAGKRGFPEDTRAAANQKLQAEEQQLDEQAARARQARLARQAAAAQQQQQ